MDEPDELRHDQGQLILRWLRRTKGQQGRPKDSQTQTGNYSRRREEERKQAPPPPLSLLNDRLTRFQWLEHPETLGELELHYCQGLSLAKPKATLSLYRIGFL